MISLQETKRIKGIINDYFGEPMVRGTKDCNLLILEIYEPELYETMVGRYKTIVGGVRAAKRLTGFSSIREYIESSSKYTEVEAGYEMNGDIVLLGDDHAIKLVFGGDWFGVTEEEKFGVLIPCHYDNYKIYRKVN